MPSSSDWSDRIRRCGQMALLAALLLGQPGAAQSPPPAEWSLVWSDEFNAPQINPAYWSLEDDCWGGGNEELQCYRPSGRNAAVANGTLVITARREAATGPAWPLQVREGGQHQGETASKPYTSAKLTTRGKAAWRYGKVEVRAKLPRGQGTWPAIWMLPASDSYGAWAASGEIDILEAVNLGEPCRQCPGGRENRILGTLHYGGSWPKNEHKGEVVPFAEVLDGQFHTYGIEWTPDRITWQFDGRTYATRTDREWWSAGSKDRGAPFDRDFYLIFNLAIGGHLTETPGKAITSGFPKRMEVDWVRVWQKPSQAATSPVSGGR
jgi:beta-glucanase (GH16 family)